MAALLEQWSRLPSFQRTGAMWRLAAADPADAVAELRRALAGPAALPALMVTRRLGWTERLLPEVTRILPDDTFLDRLLIGQGSVQMQGKSDNAQQLIGLVNQSGLFRDASFRGPTRIDTRTQKEIFDLTATLVQGDG